MCYFAKAPSKTHRGRFYVCYETDMGLKNELIEAVKVANCGIHTLETSPKRECEGVGANGHYFVCTHAHVAAEVANAIKKLL